MSFHVCIITYPLLQDTTILRDDHRVSILLKEPLNRETLKISKFVFK